jgi:hypothetical protein
MFPVWLELNYDILVRRNSVFERLIRMYSYDTTQISGYNEITVMLYEIKQRTNNSMHVLGAENTSSAGMWIC